MSRNLDRRIEVAFPLLDPVVRQQVLDLMDIQWSGRTKARVIDAAQTNPYRTVAKGEKKVHAQAATYAYLKKMATTSKTRSGKVSAARTTAVMGRKK